VFTVRAESPPCQFRISNFQFLFSFILHPSSFILLLLLPAAAAPPPVVSLSKPNIIYFLADDLGYYELGCYGQEKIKTPNIDRLAAEGMKFTQHYSGQTVCAPSRCAFLTGKHMGHAQIRNNKGVGGWGKGQAPLHENTTTIATMLKAKGYATGCVGKWGLGNSENSGTPSKQSFDFFFGFHCQLKAHHFYPDYLWKNDEKIMYPGNDTYKGSDYCATEMNKEALGFIRENKDKPFFLYYATPIPHVSLHVPEEDLAEYKGQWEEKPFENDAIEQWEASGRKRILAYTPHPTPRAAYAAMISHMDRNVGKLMDELDKLGLTENTLFIFTSDNGTTFTGGVDRKFFNSLGELSGFKMLLGEGGIKVPFVARWPEVIKAGRTSDHISASWDMLATFAEITGSTIPKDTDGISILPELSGKEQTPHDSLYWEFSSKGGQQAVRMGKWKGLRKNLSKSMHTSLYDLETDPGERKDLSADYPEVLAKIEGIMQSERTPSKSFPMKWLDQTK